MSFNTVGQYNPNHKTWDHVGNVIPKVDYCEGQRPHGEFKVAPWLPVQFYDKRYEVWKVVNPGKLVAFDNNGDLVPAQYGTSGAAQVTYTSDDVDAGVIDVRTGVALVTGGIGSFAVSGVSAFLGGSDALAVSDPCGVCPQAYNQWAGDSSTFDDGTNPAGYRQHNFNMQHRVTFLADYVIELPLVPASASSENMTRDSFADNVQTLTALSNLPVARNTTRTPVAFEDGTLTDSATAFLNQVPTAADIHNTGDWHIDYDTGVVSLWAASELAAGNIYAVSYYHYASAPSSVSKFACAVGDLKAGDFVKCDLNSNFQVATTEDFKDIMGQVIEVEDLHGKSLLDRVRTAYNPAIDTNAAGSLPAYTGQMDQMPGSATGGVPANIHYAGAADRVVRVNLISR